MNTHLEEPSTQIVTRKKPPGRADRTALAWLVKRTRAVILILGGSGLLALSLVNFPTADRLNMLYYSACSFGLYLGAIWDWRGK